MKKIIALSKMREVATGWRRRYENTFTTDDGPAVLADIMKASSYQQTTYVAGDPHETAFREGRRSLALYIQNRLRFTPEQLDEIIKREKSAS